MVLVVLVVLRSMSFLGFPEKFHRRIETQYSVSSESTVRVSFWLASARLP